MMLGQLPGGNQIPGGGASGGGDGGGRPIAQGAARDMSVVLTPDQQSLLITLTPNDNANYSVGANYTIFWLDPTLFSSSDVYAQVRTGIGSVLGLNLVQGRKKVVDVNGGDGVVSAVVGYQPYITGGWMYAVVLPVGSVKEARLSGTNFCSVPVLGAAGEPLSSEVPTNLLVQNAIISGSLVLVQFTWTNPVTLSTVSSIQITGVNYWNDGFQRNFALFKINTRPGAVQGAMVNAGNVNGVNSQQAIVLVSDSAAGAHNIDWYFVPVSAAGTPLHLTASPKVTTPAI